VGVVYPAEGIRVVTREAILEGNLEAILAESPEVGILAESPEVGILAESPEVGILAENQVEAMANTGDNLVGNLEGGLERILGRIRIMDWEMDQEINLMISSRDMLVGMEADLLVR